MSIRPSSPPSHSHRHTTIYNIYVNNAHNFVAINDMPIREMLFEYVICVWVFCILFCDAWHNNDTLFVLPYVEFQPPRLLPPSPSSLTIGNMLMLFVTINNFICLRTHIHPAFTTAKFPQRPRSI